MIYIGIDPGQITGFAAWCSSERKLLEVTSHGRKVATKSIQPFPGFWAAMRHVQKYRIQGPVTLHIEAPNLNPPVFGETMRGAHKERARLKVAQDVGMNKREAMLWIQWAKENGVPFQAVKPGRRSFSKLSQGAFQRITGWEKQTNEHGRDAAMLVFGAK